MKVYIIHGYLATPKDHWFLWTKKELEKLNINVEILNLPTPNKPIVEQWQETLKKVIKDIDENTYFITHSLGSITLLKYLQEKNIQKIGGFILVSPFNKSLPILKELDSFIEADLDYTHLSSLTKNKTIISAKDDSIVPTEFSKSLASSLKAKFVSLQKGGHFLGSDGFTEFPLLIKEFKKFI